jgi:phosphocarrier protein
MKQKPFKITNPNGIHIKPAQTLVKKVMEFAETEVTIAKDGDEVSAKSIVGILGLELSGGSEISITVNGGSEEECLSQIESVLRAEEIII